MSEQYAPITNYLQRFNAAVGRGDYPPAMDPQQLGADGVARVERFLSDADPQGLAYRLREQSGTSAEVTVTSMTPTKAQELPSKSWMTGENLAALLAHQRDIQDMN